MSKEKKEHKYSVHHILPRSRRGNDDACNLEILRDTYHRSLHHLFANQLIAEQLITTVNISAKALRDDVRQWLLETLEQRDIHNPNDRYRPDVIK